MAVEAVVFTQIVDVNWDQAIYTASPNNTINVAQFAAKGSGTNIAVALTPKGTGYISAHVPTSTAAGGAARGANSVDLQTSRTDQFHVANGAASVVLGGSNNGANGANSIAGGAGSYSQSERSIALGDRASSTARDAVAVGSICSASAVSALATGARGQAYLANMRSHGGFALAVSGGSQEICLPLAGKTTTNAEVILTLESVAKPILRTNTIWTGILHITGAKSDGSAIARYHRQLTISRVVNATSLVGAVVSVGTDVDAGTTINITANDSDDALSVGVTGIVAETWRWVAVFHGAELAIGA